MIIRFKPLVLSLLLTPLMGQSIAQQGTAADLKPNGFTSPMVVELPLDRLKVPEPGDVYPFTDQDKFVCEDVSIPLILVQKSIGWSKQVKLTIRTTVYVRPSHDRKVTLRYTLVGGDGKLGPMPSLVTDQEISAKERKHRSDSSTLELTQEAFDNLFKGEGHPKLKLVMTVASDR
jgi:hypothetical protein